MSIGLVNLHTGLNEKSIVKKASQKYLILYYDIIEEVVQLMSKKLFDYQQKIVDSQNKKSSALFMDMG